MKSIKFFTFNLLAILFAAVACSQASASADGSIAINGNKDTKDYPVLNPSKTNNAINMDGGDEEAYELYGYKDDSLSSENKGSIVSNQVLASGSSAKNQNMTLADADKHIRHELAALKMQLDVLKKELKELDEIRSDILGLKKVALMHAQGIDDNSRDIDYQLRTLKNLGADIATSKTDFDVISKEIESRLDRKATELSDTNSVLNLKVEKSADELKTLKIVTYTLFFVIVLLAGLLFLLYKLSRQVSKLKKKDEKKTRTIVFKKHSEEEKTETDDKKNSSSYEEQEEPSADNEANEESLEEAEIKKKIGKKKDKKAQKPSPKPFHSLVLRISDDIAKMETQLFGLEKDSEDYKELNKAIERKKKIAKDNGYIISGYSGLEYRIDMPYEAEFIKDTTLDEGKALVCGMLKMQVEYKGQIVQQAKLLVRENY